MTDKKKTKKPAMPVAVVKQYMKDIGCVDPHMDPELRKIAKKMAKNPPPIAPDAQEDCLRKINTTFRSREDAMANRDRLLKRLTPYTRDDGSKYTPPYDDDEKTTFEKQAAIYKMLADAQSQQLEVMMLKIPLWNIWLKDVPGMGVNVAAPLLGKIRFDRCLKPSSIHQFAGLGFHVDESGAVRGQRGKTGETHDWCADIRRALYIFGDVLNKGKNKGEISKSKYCKIYLNKYYGKLSEYGLSAANEPEEEGEESTGKKKHTAEQKALFAKAKTIARRVACRVFLEDLYIVGRTLAGLPVWPDYNAAKLGYGHNGKITVNAPVMLTIEQALAIVNDHDSNPMAKAAE